MTKKQEEKAIAWFLDGYLYCRYPNAMQARPLTKLELVAVIASGQCQNVCAFCQAPILPEKEYQRLLDLGITIMQQRLSRTINLRITTDQVVIDGTGMKFSTALTAIDVLNRLQPLIERLDRMQKEREQRQ